MNEDAESPTLTAAAIFLAAGLFNVTGDFSDRSGDLIG